MNNWISINGRHSATVTGLIIQELPPIVKPPMRTEITEVDGRDGDVIDRLGYAAYDRPLRIGLRGNFDIDKVISYFDQSGKITFSNEPDKYYLFDILEQIDFERLLRFRTADVQIHVQPGKYAVADAPLTINASGISSASIYNFGNTKSTPKINVIGEGDITLSLNGVEVLEIELGTNGNVIIDTFTQNAVKDGVFMNRIIYGNPANLRFKPGKNTLSWSGTVESFIISDASKWI